MGELLGREDRRLGRHDEGAADDGGATSDLARAYWAFRHPAVIAALSGLEHLGFAASLQLSLVGDGLRGRALYGGAHLFGRKRGDPEIETFLREESLVSRHQYVETHEGHHALDRQGHTHGRPPLTRSLSVSRRVRRRARPHFSPRAAPGQRRGNAPVGQEFRSALESRSSRSTATVNRADTSSKICRSGLRPKTE